MTDEEAARFLEEMMEIKRSIGPFQELLRSSSKKEIERTARQVVINMGHFQALIMNHIILGYLYEKETFTHMPTERPRKNTVRKDMNYLSQRKTTTYHLFYNSSCWHILYFNYGDILNNNEHFAKGGHIHYVSSIWERTTKEGIVAKLKERSYDIKSIHLRFDAGITDGA